MGYQYIFWTLIISAIIILLGIIIIGSSIAVLVKTNLFQEKAKEKREKAAHKVKKTAGILLLLLISNTLFAGEESSLDVFYQPDFKDVLGLAILNLLLLFVLFYFKNLFDRIAKSILPEELIAEESALKSLNKVLTDAVDLENEEAILMDHEYDGIRELDNNLPPWWKWGFYISIVFAIVYLGHYHVFKTGDLQVAAYEKEMAAAELLYKDMVDESSVEYLPGSDDLAAGKALYAKNCVSCHGNSGEGGIGVNFTDDYWIYGNDAVTVFKTIKYGAKNGMKSWESEFTGLQIQQLASFVMSLQGNDVEGGKEAQGTEFKSTISQ